MTPEDKLRMIRDILDHPSAYHWGGEVEIVRLIKRVLDSPAPDPAKVIRIDGGTPRWDLTHDAVSSE